MRQTPDTGACSTYSTKPKVPNPFPILVSVRTSASASASAALAVRQHKLISYNSNTSKQLKFTMQVQTTKVPFLRFLHNAIPGLFNLGISHFSTAPSSCFFQFNYSLSISPSLFVQSKLLSSNSISNSNSNSTNLINSINSNKSNKSKMNQTTAALNPNIEVLNAPEDAETVQAINVPTSTISKTTTTTTTAESFTKPTNAVAIQGFKSYLNTDGIDHMKPAPKKKTASSLSLSDQWGSMHGGLTSLSRSGSTNRRSSSRLNLKSQSKLSMASLSSLGEHGVRYKKDKIDHPRVASYAFAFDIDGVIVRGPDTVPFAKGALQMLNGKNPYNIKVPYIFVTNGGGRPESERAAELSKRLDVEVTEEQVIQGHTPMKDLVDVYQNVLVVGGVGDKCRKIAHHYGFKNVFIPLDIMYWNPSVTPYYDLTEEDKKVCRKDVDFSKTKIDAVLVFADSRNWAADQQIILELLMSKNGYMGTVSETYEEGPGIYFAHSDFIWSTNYKLTRYGMGALQVTIAALFRESTGKELKVTRFGKPQRGTFKFAEKVLTNWRKDVLEEYVEDLESTMGSETSEDVNPLESSDSDEGLEFSATTTTTTSGAKKINPKIDHSKIESIDIGLATGKHGLLCWRYPRIRYQIC
ncbi:unnamed protein product [Ambrosiozyma monospora]|uniref:Unnamed protein product n=1 Tax=Ambrosiozyma monospora TaxID=43982 RepID=A0A9W6YUM1_AMBMO|nr:unnamed protein product [Ambrosiozyma monospora]